MKFRFSISDLLWLTLIVAVGLSWWSYREKFRSGPGSANADPEVTRASGEK